MILCGAPQYSSDGNPTKSHIARQKSHGIRNTIYTSDLAATQNRVECSMSEKLVHHLFGQHSLRYVPRSEVDISPAQIFTHGGQHPPVSRILVFVSQRAFLSERDLQSLRTGSATVDALQADGNVKASEFLDIVGDLQTCSCRGEKKKGHCCL